MLLFLAAALLHAPPVPPADGDDRSPRNAAAQRHGGRDDDDEEEGHRVDESSPIVVTARRLDAARTRIDEGLGATVYALSNDAIENRPGGETGSIASILTQTPGVTLHGESLTIRGSRANQVRINDVIVPEAIADPADHLSARLAETTHIITGTLPAQFGFAPAGVISVTTKSGTYQHGGQLEMFGRTDGMIEPAAEWAGAVAGTSLFASASFERERTGIADLAGRSAHDLRRGIEGLAFADHLLGASDRVSLILGGSRQRDRIGATSIGAGTTRADDVYAVGSYQHSSDGVSLQASLFAGAATDAARFAQASRERRSTFGTQIDAAYQPAAAHLIRAGALVARNDATELDPGGKSAAAARTSVGLYAQDEWKLAPALTFNPGVRIEWLHGLASAATAEPRASLVWASPGGLTLHAGYARYAAAAPLRGAPAGQALPDERDDYLDAGLQQRVDAFTFGVDAYWRSVRNLLSERVIPGDAIPLPFAFARAELRGLEISATYARGPVSAWANLALSRARGRTILGGAGLFAPATILAAASRWISLSGARPFVGSGGVTWRIGSFSLTGEVEASSGAVRTASPADPNGARGSPVAMLGVTGVYHARIDEHPIDLRLDLTNLSGVRPVTNDAADLEGGWTRRAQGRAATIGIEFGF
jgi:hypothetical protein